MRAALLGAACGLGSVAACGGPISSSGPPQWERPGLMGAVRPEMGPPQPGDPAPDFELPAATGSFRLASLRGGWVLLHFTASWCPYCDAEVGHLGELADAYAARNVRVVLVGVKEEPQHWAEYTGGHVAPSVLALDDADGAVAKRFAPPRAQPSFANRSQVVLDSTLVVDPQGVIRLFLFPDSKHFNPTFHAVRAELDRLLADAPAPKPIQPASGPSVPKEPVEVVAIQAAAPVRVAAGEAAEVAVTLSIAPGYHVMSDRPSDPLYIPTRVVVTRTEGITWGEPRYPEAVPFRLSDRSIATFQNRVTVRLPFEVAPGATASRRTVEGTVRYQACTEASCLFPVTRPISATIDVTPR